MKSTIIVDTGIIVEYLKTGKGALPDVYEKYTMVIPSLTITEILASKTFTDKALEDEVVVFIHKYFKVEDVTEKVSHKAAQIVRETGLNLMSAIIAASAVSGGHKLLTDQTKHYSKVDGIELLEI